MPKISTYSTVPPADSDLILITDVSDSNNTKNVTVSALRTAISSYTEIYDATAGEITTISNANTFVLLVATTIQGATNDATLVNNGLGRITNTGTQRTFIVNYSASASAVNNNNLMFRIHKNASAVAYSESDTICGSGGKATSVSNAVIVTLNTSEYIEIYVANSATQNVTLEHLNIIMRQI
jgi:hypothetical protein